MSKYFRNRKAEEIRAFLEANGYKKINTNGDDDIYAKDKCQYTVKIPSRNSEIIPKGTMSQIKKMIRWCGIDDKQILNWWKGNDYGE